MRTLITLLAALLLAGCSRSREQAFSYNQGSVFGTTYHIKYLHPDGTDLHDGIKGVLADFDASLSTYNPDSLISRINRNEPGITVDDYMEHCFTRAQEIARDTKGAFDITVGPLVNAWGFGFSKRSEITPGLIESILDYTGHELVRMEDRRIIKQYPEIQLDVNAIAKGMAVDVVAEFLKNQGCEDLMVEIGGEVVARGKNPQNIWWRIGINKPVDDAVMLQQELQTVVDLKNTALATSGNYRNFYIRDGVKYAHTIDPSTGYPVQHSLLSATVFAPDCLTADAYATAFMVMGIEKARKIVERHPEMEAYFIYNDDAGSMHSWQSPGFGK